MANPANTPETVVIPAQIAAQGDISYTLPIDAQAIDTVEAIDLDLLITTQTGEKFLLQQGALQAATNPESKLTFKNGEAQTTADQLKKVGLMKPVEGGSFRLASALTPEAADKVSGNEFGLGKDSQDTVSKLEKIIQALDTSTPSNPSSESNSYAQGGGKNAAFKSNVDPLASPAPGTPPKPDESKTSYTSDSENQLSQSARGISPLNPSQQEGIYVSKIGDKFYTSPEKPLGVSISEVPLNQTKSTEVIHLSLVGKNELSIEPESGYSIGALKLPGVKNATHVVLSTGSLPTENGVVIVKSDGQTLAPNTSYVVATSSLQDLIIPYNWKQNAVLDDGKTDAVFSIAVKFFNGTTELNYGNAPLNFYYGENPPSEIYDSNSNLRIYLSKNAYTYNITGTNDPDTITAGSGDDVIVGGPGDDKLDGSSGNDTLDYSASTAAMTVNFGSTATDRTATGTGYGTTTFANIEKIITGSAADTFTFISADTNSYSINGGYGSDTLDYSASTAAMTVNFGSTATDRTATGTGYGTTTFANIESITTGSAADTFKFKSADASSYAINGGSGSDTLDYSASTAAMTVNFGNTATDRTAAGTGYGTTTFANIESITTGSAADTFKFKSADTNSYSIDGGSNTGSTTPVIDTLDYSAASVAMTVNLGANAAERTATSTTADQYGTTTFANIEKIITGSAADTFKFKSADTNSYSIDGGSSSVTGVVDTLDYSAANVAMTINLGATAADRTATSTTSGQYGTTTFANIEKIITGSGADTLKFKSADTNSYSIDGGSNTSSTTPVIDTLDYSAASVAMTVNLGANAAERIATSTTAGQYGITTFANIEKVTTGSGADTFKFKSADTNSYSIDGGSSSVTGVVDTLDYSVSDAAMTVNFSNTATDRTATGTGYGTTTFANIEKIITGSAADTFKFKSADTNNYSINGGSSSVTGVVDTLDYSDSTAAMTVNFGSAATDRTATGTGYGTTTFANIESITTGSGADTFKFKSADANSYSINGGSGSDTLDYSASTAAMTVNFGSTATDLTATGTGYGTTTFANIEKIITGYGNDNITIASTNTTAYTIDAGGGNDTVTGNGASTLSYANNSTGIKLTVNQSNGSSTGAGNDTFTDFKNFKGSSGNDSFTLTSGDTTSYSLQGESKQDTFLIANKNNATINGGSSLSDDDTLSFANDTSKVTINNINAGAGEANDADGGKIIFSNIKTFIGGSGGSDFTVNSIDTNGYTLQGGTGANILTGGAGKDTLMAGSSNDKLNGGAGDDTLDFHTNHVDLASVTANGGDGNDKVILDQDKLSGTTINFDGGTNTPVTSTSFGDTLVIWKGSSTAALDLKNLNARNFETLDLKTDTSSNSVIFSATTVQNLVGAGNNSTLTLRMGSEDSFIIDNSAALYTQGQSIKFYSDASHNTQIAQVNFTYV